MNAIESIMERTSIRAYKPKQIDNEALQKILQAGMAAPVGSNAYDALHMTVVQDRDLFPIIDKAVSDMIFSMLGKRMDKAFGAPTMVFISSKPAIMPGIEYANAACVLENMAIAATSLGCKHHLGWGCSSSCAKRATAKEARDSRRLQPASLHLSRLCPRRGACQKARDRD